MKITQVHVWRGYPSLSTVYEKVNVFVSIHPIVICPFVIAPLSGQRMLTVQAWDGWADRYGQTDWCYQTYYSPVMWLITITGLVASISTTWQMFDGGLFHISDHQSQSFSIPRCNVNRQAIYSMYSFVLLNSFLELLSIPSGNLHLTPINWSHGVNLSVNTNLQINSLLTTISCLKGVLFQSI